VRTRISGHFTELSSGSTLRLYEREDRSAIAVRPGPKSPYATLGAQIDWVVFLWLLVGTLLWREVYPPLSKGLSKLRDRFLGLSLECGTLAVKRAPALDEQAAGVSGELSAQRPD
jgi:hypothetical protein